MRHVYVRSRHSTVVTRGAISIAIEFLDHDWLIFDRGSIALESARVTARICESKVQRT